MWKEIAVWTIGWVGVSFGLWRKMRHDYAQEDVLAMLVWISVGVGAASWVRGLGFFGLVVIGVVILAIWCRFKKWDFWEWLDELGRVSCGLGAVVLLVNDWRAVWVAATLVVGWTSVVWLQKNYRKIRWYESGKPGFAGIVALEWWVVGQLVVAKASGWWVYFGTWLLVSGAVAIYLRGGRKPSNDLKRIWPQKKLSIRQK